VQVIQYEKLQWVGGGVLKAKIGTHQWSRNEPPFEIFLDRGWMRIWIKADELHHAIKIHTNNLFLSAENAEFWVNTHANVTEVYVIQGEVKDSDGKSFSAKSYATWEGQGKGVKYVSGGWDEKPLEVRIAALYPNLVKLGLTADEEWQKEKTQEIYGDLRKNGWLKAHRMTPYLPPAKN